MTHGIIPVEYKVIVKPDPVENMDGMFEKPPEVVAREERMQTRGTLVSLSEMSFRNDDGQRWRCKLPKAGDRVIYAMYAGQKIVGADEETYQVMNDKDIIAILEA